MPPPVWIGVGGALLALGLWRDWNLCTALGVGGAISGMAQLGLSDVGPLEQGLMFAGLSLVAWIGGRRMDRLTRGLHRSGLFPIGHTATAARDFHNGHGTVSVGGETYAAVCRDNPGKGAHVRVTGRTDEALKVEIKE
jgi:membrane protein implicated in regulation of membrane protease activity